MLKINQIYVWKRKGGNFKEILARIHDNIFLNLRRFGMCEDQELDVWYIGKVHFTWKCKIPIFGTNFKKYTIEYQGFPGIYFIHNLFYSCDKVWESNLSMGKEIILKLNQL